MYWCESWTRKKAEGQNIDAFELWCWRGLLRVPWLQRDQTSQSKGNQSWIIGKTDAEAEAPVLWPPDAKSWLIRKAPDAGKDWRQEEKGMTGWECWMASPTRWTWVQASSRRWWRTGKPGMLQSMRLQKAGHDWVTEQQQLVGSSTISKMELNKLISLVCHRIMLTGSLKPGIPREWDLSEQT